MIRGHMGLKMLLAIVVVASVFLAGVLATGNTVSALEITQYLTITSEPESGDTYRIGEVIDVTLTYNVTMDMPELAAIGISVGNNLRRASIDKERWMLGIFPAGGPITFHGEEFVFSYTVQADDFDSDGVSISETVFGFYNSTSDTYVPGPTQTSDDYVPEPIPYFGVSDDAVPDYPGLSVQSGHKVDGRPWIDHVEIVSSPASDSGYKVGENIDVDVTFTSPVDVVNDNIAASLWFGETNGDEGSVRRGAPYQDGSGTDTLRFSYQVKTGDHDSNGLHVGAKTSTGFGAGRIKAAGTDIDAVHFFAGVNSSQKVDGKVRVVMIEVDSEPKSEDTYRAGETFEIGMKFNQPVEVEGDILLSMRVGSDDPATGWRSASYRRTDGDHVIFGYTIRPSDVDTDGITVLGSWLDNDGMRHGIGGSGGIKAAGTDSRIAQPEFTGFTNLAGHKVDGRVRVDGMEVLSHAAYGGTYRAGETFEIAMVFDDAVEVEGDIHLSMRVGPDDGGFRAANYLRTHGRDALIFGYTVRFGDVDTDGITVLGSWVGYDGIMYGIGGSGSIKVAGTDFEIEPPEFTGVTNLGGHKVNGNPDTEDVGGL